MSKKAETSDVGHFDTENLSRLISYLMHTFNILRIKLNFYVRHNTQNEKKCEQRR